MLSVVGSIRCSVAQPVAHVPQEPHPRGSFGASPHEAIREAASRIGWNVVFENATLGQLANHLIRYVVGAEACPIAVPDLKANIDTMVAIHSNLGGSGKALPSSRRVVDQFNAKGSHLLASLLSHEDVFVVCAFNRPPRTPFRLAKLLYIEGDTAPPNLSLDPRRDVEIRNAVMVITPNGWRLEFNLVLSSFEPNVRGATEEVAEFTKFVTEMTQRVSKTTRGLEPISGVQDAARWGDYWVSVGMFSEGVLT